MLAQARAAGLREYGVSEHIYQLDEGHLVMPDEPDEGKRYPCAWYLETVRDAQTRSADLAVKLGLEVDFLPGRHAELLAVTDGIQWDYLLGSVHEVDGVDIFRNGG